MSGYRAAGEAIYEMARGVVQPAFILTACLLAIGIFMLDSVSLSREATAGIVPFTFGPLFVSLVLALFARRIACQIALIIGSVLYAACVYDIVSSRDAQAGIALLFIGFMSLPVMIPVWLMTLYFMRSEKQAPDKQDDELANLTVAEEVEGCPSDE